MAVLLLSCWDKGKEVQRPSIDLSHMYDPRVVGLPLYPNSRVEHYEVSKYGDEVVFLRVILNSDDSMDDISSFYRKHLPASEEEGAEDRLQLTSGDFRVQITDLGSFRRVVILRFRDASP